MADQPSSETLAKSTAKMIRETAKEFTGLMQEVANELSDAATDIAANAASPADLVARLRTRAETLSRDVGNLDISPMLKDMEDAAQSFGKLIWRKGFESGLRTFAHWHDGEQQVGSTGTTLKQAIDDLYAGKFDAEYSED